MNALLEEAPALFISALLLASLTVLLALRILPVNDPLVNTIFVGIISFWISNGSSRLTARQIGSAQQPHTDIPPATHAQEEDHTS
jgi:hypothetical protein